MPMSGHSKWSKIKHQKEGTDAQKAKIFTKLAFAITMATRIGGGSDPDNNIRLRFAIDKARGANMPKEKIAQAVARAAGSTGGADVQEVLYEAFGPAGIGILIEATTDNRQRTVAAIKNILTRAGGTLATSGAVSHQFEHVGSIILPKDASSFESIMETALDANALDIVERDDHTEIVTKPQDVHRIVEALRAKGWNILSAELCFHPTTTIPISDTATKERIEQLLSALTDIDDVQHVTTNADTD